MKRYLALCLAVALCAMAQEVLLVKGVSDGKIPQSELNSYARRVGTRLSRTGISYRSAEDDKLSAKSFDGISVAVFPYNCALREGALEAVASFVANGGKLLVFYSSDVELLRHLGIDGVNFRSGDDMAEVEGVGFEKSFVAGLPEGLVQRSRCMNEPALSSGTNILGQWMAAEGRRLPLAAATLNANGMYFSHVFLDQDAERGGRFWTAILGRYAPNVWREAAEFAIARVPRQDGLERMEDIVERVRRTDNRSANEKVSAARSHYDNARLHFLEKKYQEAIDDAEAALRLCRESVLMTFSSRPSELRGAWIHSAYGIKGWDWDATVRVLAENGFNAIFPNMSWSYVADYRSDVLPVHPDVEQFGDQIEACLAACRKYGVELHVWHVCWNMGHRTPAELVKKMQDAKRTQISVDGGVSRFLAPHMEENFSLEKEAFLEIVRKYDVDGIHFDYIRYPDSRCDFSDGARAAFEAKLGHAVAKWPDDCRPGGAHYAAYNKWRQDNVSRLVEAVSKGAHAIKPKIKVSAAVYGEWDGACEWVAQDAALWVKNGWLDFICPMNYSAKAEDFREWLSRQLEVTAPLLPIYPGIGAYMTESPVDVAEQIRIARTIGADGFVCFSLTERFAKETLPMLRLSSTAIDGSKFMPHNSTHVGFTVKGGAKELDGQLLEGDDCTMEVILPQNVRLNKNLSLTLERNGVQVEGDVDAKMTAKGASCSFVADVAGYWRLVVAEPRRGILARSPSVRVLDEAEAAEWRLRKGPPRFLMNGGVRVAVWQDNAYGAGIILRELASVDGIDVASLYNLEPENLKRVQVIVLPQPRKNVKQFKDMAMAKTLADFVSHGGGLMTTHSMVGARGFVNAVPSVVSDVRQTPLDSDEWRVAGRHAITKGLPAEIQRSTFGDMYAMTLEKSAQPVLLGKDGGVVMAAGSFGRGRYVPCGLGLAISRGDGDSELTPAEKTLLKNAILWLGRKIK